jgi:hypothetical protein
MSSVQAEGSICISGYSSYQWSNILKSKIDITITITKLEKWQQDYSLLEQHTIPSFCPRRPRSNLELSHPPCLLPRVWPLSHLVVICKESCPLATTVVSTTTPSSLPSLDLLQLATMASVVVGSNARSSRVASPHAPGIIAHDHAATLVVVSCYAAYHDVRARRMRICYVTTRQEGFDPSLRAPTRTAMASPLDRWGRGPNVTSYPKPPRYGRETQQNGGESLTVTILASDSSCVGG